MYLIQFHKLFCFVSQNYFFNPVVFEGLLLSLLTLFCINYFLAVSPRAVIRSRIKKLYVSTKKQCIGYFPIYCVINMKSNAYLHFYDSNVHIILWGPLEAVNFVSLHIDLFGQDKLFYLFYRKIRMLPLPFLSSNLSFVMFYG